LAAAQGQQDGLGVVRDVLDTRPGGESGKAVQVAQLLWGWHLPIVTTFLGQGKPESPAILRVSEGSGRKIYPLDFKMSQRKRSLEN
jgi:hypothetical protein